VLAVHDCVRGRSKRVNDGPLARPRLTRGGAQAREHSPCNRCGINVEALRKSERWIIEAKGGGSRDAMRVNYFIAMLGETLQRMSDPDAR